MRVASVSNAYNEARFLEPFLNHLPDWVEKKIVLITDPPWFGKTLEDDGSQAIAEACGAEVVKRGWKNEHDQRNTGQGMLADYDWILTMEPDEFLSDAGWDALHDYLKIANKPAYAARQRVMWGTGYESDPPEDFVPIIATRPTVKFVEKRNVNTYWETLPPDVILYHWVWGRTDSEIWKKVSHYSHAVDFDIRAWFKDVWLARKTENLHPTTPSSIPKLKKALLPPELEQLNLFPEKLDDITPEEVEELLHGT